MLERVVNRLGVSDDEVTEKRGVARRPTDAKLGVELCGDDARQGAPAGAEAQDESEALASVDPMEFLLPVGEGDVERREPFMGPRRTGGRSSRASQLDSVGLYRRRAPRRANACNEADAQSAEAARPCGAGSGRPAGRRRGQIQRPHPGPQASAALRPCRGHAADRAFRLRAWRAGRLDARAVAPTAGGEGASQGGSAGLLPEKRLASTSARRRRWPRARYAGACPQRATLCRRRRPLRRTTGRRAAKHRSDAHRNDRGAAAVARRRRGDNRAPRR